jgi:ribosome biogenesis protein Tsr3
VTDSLRIFKSPWATNFHRHPSNTTTYLALRELSSKFIMAATATALAVFGTLEQAADFVKKFDWSKV